MTDRTSAGSSITHVVAVAYPILSWIVVSYSMLTSASKHFDFAATTRNTRLYLGEFARKQLSRAGEARVGGLA